MSVTWLEYEELGEKDIWPLTSKFGTEASFSPVQESSIYHPLLILQHNSTAKESRPVTLSGNIRLHLIFIYLYLSKILFGLGYFHHQLNASFSQQGASEWGKCLHIHVSSDQYRLIFIPTKKNEEWHHFTSDYLVWDQSGQISITSSKWSLW